MLQHRVSIHCVPTCETVLYKIYSVLYKNVIRTFIGSVLCIENIQSCMPRVIV